MLQDWDVAAAKLQTAPPDGAESIVPVVSEQRLLWEGRHGTYDQSIGRHETYIRSTEHPSFRHQQWRIRYIRICADGRRWHSLWKYFQSTTEDQQWPEVFKYRFIQVVHPLWWYFIAERGEDQHWRCYFTCSSFSHESDEIIKEPA